MNYIYMQREKFINKYLKFAALIVPMGLATYPTIHFNGMERRLSCIFVSSIGAAILLVPLIFVSLKRFYVYEDKIIIKGLLYKKKFLYEDVIKCFFKSYREVLCLYMADREVKLHIGTYNSSKDIVDNMSRYISIKEV
ncbi:hypothetical protein [Butyrivibrio sp. M55]|uniref:hypothetical protein n=1 Tax=Butyrivibrio sp. M55 TaxID=1855323 RepID=UPI0008F16682|nr:hypothetical protein [Butyrivibrio sp. M55]SFU67558.1 hypothetical protein SAMN05216540_105254 [Butyrivibrio sp. M55]